MQDDQVTHWNRHARNWRHIGPPLRPTAEDVAYLRQVVATRFPTPGPRGPVRGLLLGVTPEIAGIDWQPELALVAVDRSQAMIDEVWPGDTGRRRAICSDWLDMPVDDGSIDVAIGDGCFNALAFPDEQRRLAARVARALAPGGLFAMRSFCRLEPGEPVSAVFDDLAARAIGNFHVFKWRLLIALQGADSARGVTLGDAWSLFHAHVNDPAALAAQHGWPLEEVRGIDSYRGSRGVYSFPAHDETAALLGEKFEVLERWQGRYELAERCPHFLLRRR